MMIEPGTLMAVIVPVYALTDSARPLEASMQRFLRSRAGDIGLRKVGAGAECAIVMRMPGCILPAAKDRQIG